MSNDKLTFKFSKMLKQFKTFQRIVIPLNDARNILLGLLLVCSCVFSQTINAQDLQVTGQVTDQAMEPLPGVSVIIRGTTVGTVTDVDGRFALTVPRGSILVFSFVGMQTQEIPIVDQTEVNVVLSEAVTALDEIVVIGYGTQSRRTITTAITRIESEEVEDLPLSSVSTALQGKLAGVRVFQSGGGQPGSNSTIRIRGGSSITQTNAPLILVDGIERNLNNINPSDLESIQVLKDAASTAIYGSRASNGVVLVTTKQGRIDKAEITFSSNTGFASPWRVIDLMGAEDYLNLVRPAVYRSRFRNQLDRAQNYGGGNTEESQWSPRYLGDGEPVPDGYLSMPDPIDPTRTLIYQDNNFMDLALNNRAMEQYYNLSANGGNEQIRYAASIGYTDIEGTFIDTYYNRFTARANVDFSLSRNLNLTTRIDHSTSSTNDVRSQRQVFNRSMFLVPTARAYMEDGSFGWGQNRGFTNPLLYQDINKREQGDHRTGFSANLVWDIMEGLKAEARGDYYVNDRTFEQFEKASVHRVQREAIFEYDQYRQYKLEGLMTYDKTFADFHTVNVIAGISHLFSQDKSAEARAEGGATDLIWTLNAAPILTRASSTMQDEALIGLFSRITYDYDNKYLFSASVRRDGSSRFASENRWSVFPAVSAGWIITGEDFMQNVPVVNLLKLRGSLGQTGNNSINRYAYAGLYGVGRNYFGLSGTLATDMPNRNLRWETTTQMDIGFDLGLFRFNRISILFDYYEKVTRDLLFSVPLPNETGFNNILQNVGDVKFWGYDIELRADIIDRDKFSWTGGFNVGYNMNEVLRLPDNGREQNRIGGTIRPDGTGFGGIAEGERMYSITGWVADFIIDTWEQADAALFDQRANGWSPLDESRQRGRKIPGDVEWVDMDGDGIITDFDQDVLGYTVPTHVGGFSQYFQYGDFGLNIFMDYALGHHIMDGVLSRTASAQTVGGANTPPSYILTEAWQEEGDIASGKASRPRFDHRDNQQQDNYARPSSLSTIRGDFLNLREVNLTYDASGTRVAQRLGLKLLRLNLSGQNLYYFTEYLGWTPEYSDAGNNVSDDTYPVPRKIMLGVRIGF